MRIADRGLAVTATRVIRGRRRRAAVLAVETESLDDVGFVDDLTRNGQAEDAGRVGAGQQGGVGRVDGAGGGDIRPGDGDMQVPVRQFLCDQVRVGASHQPQVDRAVDRVAQGDDFPGQHGAGQGRSGRTLTIFVRGAINTSLPTSVGLFFLINCY